MERTIGALTFPAVLLSSLVWLGSVPADATVATTVVATTIDVTMIGADGVVFACDPASSVVLVNGAPTSPTVPCADLTKVEVSGDAGDQTVDASGLDGAAFAAQPSLKTTMGGGRDTVTGTERADSISVGDGDDLVVVQAGSVADSISMKKDALTSGTADDVLRVIGTSAPDTLTVSAVNATQGTDLPAVWSPTVAWSNGSTARTYQASGGVRVVEIRAGGGSDTVTAVAPATSGANQLLVLGEAGDDTIDAGPLLANLDGGPGTNTLRGGPLDDWVVSRSHLDTVEGRGGQDIIVDDGGTRTGGRTVVPGSGFDHYRVLESGNVGTVRVRPSTTGHALLTASLNRPGQQSLDGAAQVLRLVGTGDHGPTDLTLFDVVIPAGFEDFEVQGRSGTDNLVDITVPVGTWTRTDGDGFVRVDPDDPAIPAVTARDLAQVRVHGPWSDPIEGFVHRAYRDLRSTFIDDAARAQRTEAITSGAQTRSGLVAEIMGTAGYRSLDVDRAFLTYLRRGADPSGKAYWVRSLGAGKALWRFRAQLLGSNEYFAKAGGTNAAFVARAYEDVLGRGPDPSGLAFWTGRLDSGADRGQVALQFLDAAETRRRLVDDQFLRFLDRLPTTNESQKWTAAVRANGGEQHLIAMLAASTAYFGRS